ncbi:hypothetical protein [Amaricoccus sp. W119]|uniref:hypothetical protein n=1 Tax=Amaricoccus sp. W119 TaxID=3391833 RepID=UPI0039A67E4B
MKMRFSHPAGWSPEQIGGQIGGQIVGRMRFEAAALPVSARRRSTKFVYSDEGRAAAGEGIVARIAEVPRPRRAGRRIRGVGRHGEQDRPALAGASSMTGRPARGLPMKIGERRRAPVGT